MRIASGSISSLLAQDICTALNLQPVHLSIRRFADHEVFVEIYESVRGEDVFLIQSTSPPVNDSLMELLITTDALRRSSVGRITAVIPYFGYARQDRKTSARTPISAKLVANLLVSSGISRVLTVDLHSEQIQGFFDIPIDNIMVYPLFAQHILAQNLPNSIIISPDIGGVVRARKLAEILDLDIAIIDKRRTQPGKSDVMHIVGDVKGKNCILIDDLVDSGGTLCSASDALIEAGAIDVRAYVTHGVLSGNACQKLHSSSLSSLTITDSIAHVSLPSKIQVISLGETLARVIQNIHSEESIQGLI